MFIFHVIKALSEFKKKTIFAWLKNVIMSEDFSLKTVKEKINSSKKLKLVTYILSGVVFGLLLFVLYQMFFYGPANTESKASYWRGLNFAMKDSTDKAIEELESAVENYDGKNGGEVAQFLLATQFMKKGKFDEAVTELEGTDVDDTYLSAMKSGLLADCKSEMKDYAGAVELYIEAASINENKFTTPMYLFKAGLCAEKVKDFNKAVECYQKIKDDYPDYGNRKYEKYLSRATNKQTK
jgi:tetratricopeptide (TPR) repeat protein